MREQPRRTGAVGKIIEVMDVKSKPSHVRRGSGALESEVLSALWAAETPVTAAQVHEALQAPDLAYKTVLTVVSRLFDKGQLDRKRPGAPTSTGPRRAAPSTPPG